MQPLSTDSKFEAILTADRAILFVEFVWSGQSQLSAAVIREWERTSHAWGLNCPVSIVRPDDLPSVTDWMKAHRPQLKGEGGNGSLIWLRSGTIVDYVPYVVGAGLWDISRRTKVAFRERNVDPSRPAMWDRELDG
jgi:hypothetical protein